MIGQNWHRLLPSTIARAYVDPDLCSHSTSLGRDEFKLTMRLDVSCQLDCQLIIVRLGWSCHEQSSILMTEIWYLPMSLIRISIRISVELRHKCDRVLFVFFLYIVMCHCLDNWNTTRGIFWHFKLRPMISEMISKLTQKSCRTLQPALGRLISRDMVASLY